MSDPRRTRAKTKGIARRIRRLSAALGGDVEHEDRVAVRQRLVVRREGVLQGQRVDRSRFLGSPAVATGGVRSGSVSRNGWSSSGFRSDLRRKIALVPLSLTGWSSDTTWSTSFRYLKA